MTKPTLEDLFEQWLFCKNTEDNAKKERVDIEDVIIANVGLHNNEGSKTTNYDGYKVTLKNTVYRKLDIESAKGILATIPEDLRPVKLAADETGIKWLSENRPDLYNPLSPFVEVKPGKIGVTVVRKG